MSVRDINYGSVNETTLEDSWEMSYQRVDFILEDGMAEDSVDVIPIPAHCPYFG